MQPTLPTHDASVEMRPQRTAMDPDRSSVERRSRGRRVAASEVAAALDELIERLQLDRPYTLYRHVASEAGIHPTTVLRYHQGYLGTANAALHRCVTRLLDDVRAGRPTPLQGAASGARPLRRRTRSSRIPTEQVQRKIDAIQHALGLDEHQFLYRYLAEQVGMHPTTVLRYHRGDLHTAPVELLDALDALHDKVKRGEAVPFCRSPRGGTMVLRERTLTILETLLELSGGEHKVELFRDLDVTLDVRAGTMARIYYDHNLRFVRADIHAGLERLARQTEYDPCLHYRLGERVHHHLFGVGTVLEKVHKNKVRVRFGDGKEILLAESVPADPFLNMRSGGWSTGSSSRLATHGLAS